MTVTDVNLSWFTKGNRTKQLSWVCWHIHISSSQFSVAYEYSSLQKRLQFDLHKIIGLGHTIKSGFCFLEVTGSAAQAGLKLSYIVKGGHELLILMLP